MLECMGDTNTDLLAHQSLHRIAEALRRREASILRRWEDLVRLELPAADILTFEQLRDTVPEILRQMADALGADDPEQRRRLAAVTKSHGEARYHQHFSISEFVVENRLLRQTISEEVWDDLGQLNRTEAVALNQAVDVHLQNSLVRYVGFQAEEIRAASEIQAKYLSFLSHDLRNHLNHALLVLQMLGRRLAETPGLGDALQDVMDVQRSVFDTIAAMDRLLQAERLRKGAVQPRHEPVNVRQVVEEILGRYAREAMEKGLRLESDVREPETIHSDHELLRLVLQNLIGNAVKYSRDGEVRVTAGPEDEGWSLAVSDQGPGIPPEDVTRLFEAFARGSTYGQSGVGLGLAIASHAALLLGGRLTVDSDPGRGSTFRLILPKV